MYPQLLVMTCGCGVALTAALKLPVGSSRPFTGKSRAPGAAAKMLADSPVPWPLSSLAGSVSPGPSKVGEIRYLWRMKNGCL